MKDKFAIVTGASTGIGRAVTIELAKAGFYIALVGYGIMPKEKM